jgi:hypothetical protein
VHAGRSSFAVFDASLFAAPSTAKAVDLLDEWSQRFPVLVLLHVDEADAGKSFRNIARVSVMPVENAGVADVIGAASLLVSEAALPALVARANGTEAPEEDEAAPAPAKKARPKKAETTPEPEAVAEPEVEAEAEPEAAAEAEAEPEVEAAPEADAEAEVVADAEPEAEAADESEGEE